MQGGNMNMTLRIIQSAVVLSLPLLLGAAANAGQVPGPATAPDIPISSRDRVYLSDQASNSIVLTRIKFREVTPIG